MNKTVAFALFALVVIAGIIALGWISVERPDASATFANTLLLFFGLVSSFAVTISVKQDVEKVKRQTNGTLSAKDNEIKELRAERDALLHAPKEESK